MKSRRPKILTETACPEPMSTWRPIATGKPKAGWASLLSGWSIPAAVVALTVIGLSAASSLRIDDDVPEADSIEMVIASADQAVPDELVPSGPAIVSRWDDDSGAILTLDAAGEAVAAYISRSYRVPMADSRLLTEWAVEIGGGLNVDPLLILAVAGTESSFNPKAKSKAGAEGLMQVMTRVHADKFEAFGGKTASLEPYPNMVVGTTILKSLIKRTGSVTKALKWYSGAANHRSDYGYGAKVLKERSRLMVAAHGDADKAVRLLREKKTGPAYRENAVIANLDYSHWTKAADAARRVKVASKGGDSRPRPASEAAGKRSSEILPGEELPGDGQAG